MAKKKKILTDIQLNRGIKKRKKQKCFMLEIVKYIYDNSDKSLKESKDFYDNYKSN